MFLLDLNIVWTATWVRRTFQARIIWFRRKFTFFLCHVVLGEIFEIVLNPIDLTDECCLEESSSEHRCEQPAHNKDHIKETTEVTQVAQDIIPLSFVYMVLRVCPEEDGKVLTLFNFKRTISSLIVVEALVTLNYIDGELIEVKNVEQVVVESDFTVHKEDVRLLLQLCVNEFMVRIVGFELDHFLRILTEQTWIRFQADVVDRLWL